MKLSSLVCLCRLLSIGCNIGNVNLKRHLLIQGKRLIINSEEHPQNLLIQRKSRGKKACLKRKRKKEIRSFHDPHVQKTKTSQKTWRSSLGVKRRPTLRYQVAHSVHNKQKTRRRNQVTWQETGQFVDHMTSREFWVMEGFGGKWYLVRKRLLSCVCEWEMRKKEEKE